MFVRRSVQIAPRGRSALALLVALAGAALLVGALAGCDRTTQKSLQAAADEGAPAAGPRDVSGGVLFGFDAPEAQTVHLAGSFNNWSAAADPLAKNPQGRWTLVKPLPAGTHQYKFVINGGQQWKEDPSNPRGADDGFGGKNSLLEIGADGKVAAGTGAAVAVGAPATTKVAGAKAAAATGGPERTDKGYVFAFDMPGAQSVYLAGSFNSWSTSADPMTKDANGRWTLVKQLPAGAHQYKFVINGGEQWKEDPANPNSADDGYGGKNSLLQAGDPAGGAVGGTAGGSTAKPTLAPGGPQKTAAGYVFTLDLPGAESVHLAGSFNGWSTSADPLAKGADGRWTLVKQLPAGAHQYKFVIDGEQWKEDPANPNTVDDGFGGKNSVVVVP